MKLKTWCGNIIQEKIQKKAEGFGKLAPVFLEGVKFVLDVQWINYKEENPPFGVEVISYHHKWVDEDFNLNGTRVGFLLDEGVYICILVGLSGLL